MDAKNWMDVDVKWRDALGQSAIFVAALAFGLICWESGRHRPAPPPAPPPPTLAVYDCIAPDTGTGGEKQVCRLYSSNSRVHYIVVFHGSEGVAIMPDETE